MALMAAGAIAGAGIAVEISVTVAAMIGLGATVVGLITKDEKLLKIGAGLGMGAGAGGLYQSMTQGATQGAAQGATQAATGAGAEAATEAVSNVGANAVTATQPVQGLVSSVAPVEAGPGLSAGKAFGQGLKPAIAADRAGGIVASEAQKSVFGYAASEAAAPTKVALYQNAGTGLNNAAQYWDALTKDSELSFKSWTEAAPQGKGIFNGISEWWKKADTKERLGVLKIGFQGLGQMGANMSQTAAADRRYAYLNESNQRQSSVPLSPSRRRRSLLSRISE